MSKAFHHLHTRRRVHQKKERYPHPNKLKHFVDHLIYVVSIFVPTMTFLQVYKIYETRTADGISTLAFSGYFLANLVWLLYGVLHKEKPIVIMYILLALFNASIVVGTIIY